MTEAISTSRSSWLATDAEAAEVFARLGLPLVPGSDPELDGSFSRLFPFADEAGRKRILKLRSRWLSEERIAFEHALAKHLANQGLPMATPLPIEGEATWLRVREVFCEMSSFAEGRQTQPEVSDLRLLGSLLSDFHRAGQGLQGEAPVVENQIEPSALRGYFEQVQSASFCEADSTVVEESRLRFEELIGAYDAIRPGLPRALRHGDFHPWNLLFAADGKRVAALFDLDMSAQGPRSYDLAYAIFMLRGLFLGWKATDWGGLSRAFLRGYVEGSQGSLTAEEVAAIPLQIEFIALNFALQKPVGLGFPEDAPEGLRQEHRPIRQWMEEYRQELADTMESSLESAPKGAAQ